MNYRPLPKCLTVKQSPIEGLGLFATQRIEEETNLGLSHYHTENGLIRTPVGGFVNHQADFNVYIKKIDETNNFYLFTNRDVEVGEELVAYYLNEDGNYMHAKENKNV